MACLDTISIPFVILLNRKHRLSVVVALHHVAPSANTGQTITWLSRFRKGAPRLLCQKREKRKEEKMT